MMNQLKIQQFQATSRLMTKAILVAGLSFGSTLALAMPQVGQPAPDFTVVDSQGKQHQLKAAFVLTCVGSLTQYHLLMADQPKGEKKNGHFEIVSLVGTCSIHGSHVHLSISNETGTTIGGHLLHECFVYTTAEIVLGESTEHVFVRENDGTTAWEELQVKTRQ